MRGCVRSSNCVNMARKYGELAASTARCAPTGAAASSPLADTACGHELRHRSIFEQLCRGVWGVRGVRGVAEAPASARRRAARPCAAAPAPPAAAARAAPPRPRPPPRAAATTRPATTATRSAPSCCTQCAVSDQNTLACTNLQRKNLPPSKKHLFASLHLKR